MPCCVNEVVRLWLATIATVLATVLCTQFVLSGSVSVRGTVSCALSGVAFRVRLFTVEDSGRLSGLQYDV